jgi:hypothetical protein
VIAVKSYVRLLGLAREGEHLKFAGTDLCIKSDGKGADNVGFGLK